MKMLQKIKKIFASIGAFFIVLTSKVFGSVNPNDLIATLQPQPAYGVEDPNTEVQKVWDFFKFFAIPIILIIGLIIYFKKSKSSTKKKVIVIITTILITIAICWAVNYFLEPDYGMVYQNKSILDILNFRDILNISAILLIIILGLITYFKKSKSSTKKKVIVIITVILITIAICWAINCWIVNLL